VPTFFRSRLRLKLRTRQGAGYGNLVHFAAFKAHIGFYPGAAGIAAFESELQAYQHAKGSVQFPLGQPLPLELVKRIVRFRRAENLNKAAQKSAKK